MYIVRNDVDASPNSSVVELGIGNTLGGRVHLAAGILGGNNVRSNYADQVRVDREVDFKDQTWQRWKIWVDIDQGTYEYAVDGTKSGPLRLGNNDDGSGNIGLIEIEPGTALDDNRREAWSTSMMYSSSTREAPYRLHLASNCFLVPGPRTAAMIFSSSRCKMSA